MIRALFRALLAVPPLLALAGCCGNTGCNCRDSLADSLFFYFDTRFTATELDTVYLARYAKGSFALGQPLDALPLPQATRQPSSLAGQVTLPSQYTNGLLVVSNTAPFSQRSTTSGTTSNLAAYDYVLRLQRDGSRTRFYSYRVDQIILRGRYVGDGCCTCYRNSYKQVRLSRLSDADNITEFLPAGDVTDENSGSAPRTPQPIFIPR